MLSDYDKKNSFDVEKYIKYERVETKRNSQGKLNMILEQLPQSNLITILKKI